MRWTFILCLASLAFAQPGTEPKPKAEEYDVHGKAKDIAIGAEFMIHSFSGRGLTYVAKDFLVVEVALYPPKDGIVNTGAGEFALRINGKKQALAPAAAQMVAASLQFPEWQSGPRMEAGGGMGNVGVILGRPVPTQVPGGQPQPRAPRLPPTSDPDNNPGGVTPEPRVPASELVVQMALPEGPYRGPVSGFLYFPYKGKTTSIKSLDLLYQDTVLRLR